MCTGDREDTRCRVRDSAGGRRDIDLTGSARAQRRRRRRAGPRVRARLLFPFPLRPPLRSPFSRSSPLSSPLRAASSCAALPLDCSVGRLFIFFFFVWEKGRSDGAKIVTRSKAKFGREDNKGRFYQNSGTISRVYTYIVGAQR